MAVFNIINAPIEVPEPLKLGNITIFMGNDVITLAQFEYELSQTS